MFKQSAILVMIFISGALILCGQKPDKNATLTAYENYNKNLVNFFKAAKNSESSGNDLAMHLAELNTSLKKISDPLYKETLQSIVSSDKEFEKVMNEQKKEADQNLQKILPLIIEISEQHRSSAALYSAVKNLRKSLYILASQKQ